MKQLAKPINPYRTLIESYNKWERYMIFGTKKRKSFCPKKARANRKRLKRHKRKFK